ncbi:HEPN domain-containing protein [Aliivibrio logei]|uniref:HEPN domain-containing protein n=1 Tax=Aliivibrio logei TaxID=688 RepID=UPI00039C3BE1|nr:HEPN domain-containing protein [Aliivibrio logei]
MYNIFNKLRQLLGVHCLEYVLNRTGLVYVQKEDDITFSHNEVCTLRQINDLVKSTRVRLIQQDLYEDQYLSLMSRYKVNNKPLFHHYREVCGGVIPQKSSDDELLNYFYSIASREYPSMLMYSIGLVARNYNYNAVYPYDHERLKGFIGNDVIDGLSNNEDGFNHALKFVTDDGISHLVNLMSLLENIITVSFQNCTFRSCFGFDDLVLEIDKQVDFLRNIACKKEGVYSSFIGIVGLNLGSIPEIKLENLVVRQFGDMQTPNTLAKMALSNRNEQGVISSYGCIAEITHRTNFIDEIKDYSSSNSKLSIYYINKYQEAFKLALIFTTFETKGFKYVFSTMGHCTSGVGNHTYSRDARPSGYISIEYSQLPTLRYWYGLLLKQDLKTVALPIRKISQAIFERNNEEDSFIDAITALEGLFGAQGETLFKVSTSVSLFLYDTYEERTASKRAIKKLYDMRSKIVHGNNDNALTHEDISNASKEVLGITLACLAKLLKDETLFKLPSHERINHIVYSDDY